MLPQRLKLEQMQQQWAAELNPIIATPTLNGHILQNVSLSNGTTIVNHGLQRKLVGWQIVGQNAKASIYDNQASNQTPALTLSLTSDAVVTVNLWVF